MKYLFFIILISLAACNNAGSDHQKPVTDSSGTIAKKDSFSRFIYRFADTTLETKIIDTLMKLPFIIKSNAYIDSFSNHKQGISFMPDSANNKISVMAGYNGRERFETYYNFTINPASFEIRILDPLSGEYISLDEYIKKNKE